MPDIMESVIILFTLLFVILVFICIIGLLLLYMLFYWCKSIRKYIFKILEKLDDIVYDRIMH